MSDTVIFLMGCLVTAILLTGALYSVREVRRLHGVEHARVSRPRPRTEDPASE